MNDFFRSEEQLKPFMIFPKFLLRETRLNETAKLVYLLLLDRARLSKSNNWIDENGNFFLVYPIKNLARDLGKSDTTIKTALATLEQIDLIARFHTREGAASHIYVKVPQSEFSPPDGKNFSHAPARKQPTNKNKSNNNERVNENKFIHSLESL